MNNKIEHLKKVRKDIANSYSARDLNDTHIDSYVESIPMWQNVVVKEIIQETEDTKSFILVPDKDRGTDDLLPFRAGQYVSLKIHIQDSFVTRAYSLSSSPALVAKNMYRITVKRVQDGLVSNIMLDEIKVGDILAVSRPMGELGYDKLRDEENVICVAGGVGVTPFISMALAAKDKLIDCNLTIIYSTKRYEDILFKKEIEEINKKCRNVKIVVTLTKEEKEGYLNGYITKAVLAPYIKEFNTVLMCGPKSLYKSMNDILDSFNIPKRCVRYDICSVDYKPKEVETFDLKVILKNDFVLTTCNSDETLLVSMEKAGIKAPSLCRVGTCGFCRSVLLEGKLKQIGGNMTKAEANNDYIHPCVSYPESNIVLRLDI